MDGKTYITFVTVTFSIVFLILIVKGVVMRIKAHKTKHNVFDVAEYILEKSTCQEMTRRHLYAMVYYCQAWSLAWTQQPLFHEDFEAWADGAVCPELAGIMQGKQMVSVRDICGMTGKGFNKSEKKTLDSVIEKFDEKPPAFIEEVYSKDLVWKESRVLSPWSETKGIVIEKEEIMNYYLGFTKKGRKLREKEGKNAN